MPPLNGLDTSNSNGSAVDADLSASELMSVLSGDDNTSGNTPTEQQPDDHLEYELPGIVKDPAPPVDPKLPQQPETPEEVDPNQDLNTVDDASLRHVLQQYRTTLIPAMERDLQTAQTRVQELEAERQGYQQYTQNITQFGLTPQEASLGLQLAAGYKLNPAETIKRLISAATANGIQLSPDTPNVGLDAATVAQIVQQQLAPVVNRFTQQEQATQQEAQRRQQLQERVNNFFGTYPDARIHEDAIAGVIQSNPGLSLEQAYVETYKWALKNNLDWNKPLVPQLQARTNKPTNGMFNPQPSLGNRRSLQPGASINARNPTNYADVPWRQLINEAVEAARNGEG